MHSFGMPLTDHSHHLKELETFFGNSDICRNSFRLLIHFSIRLAAAGYTSEVLDLVQRSVEAPAFKPLVDGLRLHLGIPIKTSSRSRKLALQIATKITDEIAAQRDTRSVA